MSVWW